MKSIERLVMVRVNFSVAEWVWVHLAGIGICEAEKGVIMPPAYVVNVWKFYKIPS
jgi:hypothetical protein